MLTKVLRNATTLQKDYCYQKLNATTLQESSYNIMLNRVMRRGAGGEGRVDMVNHMGGDRDGRGAEGRGVTADTHHHHHHL